MQEEIENRTVALAISATKLTGRTLRAALLKVLSAWKERNHAPKIPHGKQPLKQLIGQQQGVSNLEIDKDVKSFERYAKKYGMDFAVKKDTTVSPPRHIVYFKARDADAMTAAFKEYTANSIQRPSKPSVLSQLKHFKKLVKAPVKDHREVVR